MITTRLKTAALVVAGQSPPSQSVNELAGGIPFLQGNAEFGALNPTARWEADDAPKSARKGDILVSVRAPVGAVNIADSTYGIGRGLCAVRPRNIAARYLYWLLRAASEELNSLATGSTFTAVSASDIGNLAVPVTRRGDQDRIGVYLDRETAEIDAFIADQEKLIELLAERRMSTIAAAVSGEYSRTDGRTRFVPGFGLSPSNWQATRISRYFRITLGKMLDAGRETVEGSEWLPYIRAANIQEAGLDLTSANQMPFLPREVAQFSLKAGDLLVVEGGAVGVNIYMTEDLAGWAFQKTVNRVRPLDSTRAHGRYLGYALDALRYNGTIDMIANKSTIAHLTAEKLERIVVPFPSLAEQKRLVDFLEQEMAEVDTTITDAREAIALSKERRAALISAAVTGKIDVREHGKVNA